MRQEMRWGDLQRDLPAWYEEAKLGIFVHWGAYSVAGWAEPTAQLGEIPEDEGWYAHNPYAEWYFNTIRIPGSPAQQHHREVWGGCDYDDLLDFWQAEKFDAAALMQLFAQAGASYVVLTTKHHDGITLWQAPGTRGRNTVQRGPHRDLVGEYAQAARRQGLKFGAYYSGGLDWWYRPGPPHLTAASVHDIDRPRDADYAAYALAHLRDLVRRYQPDVLWNDINWPDAGKELNTNISLGNFFAEEYYATCPEGVVNDRWRVPHCDFLTSEYQADRGNEGERPWENCRGLGLSFGYNQVEGESEALSVEEAIYTVVDAAARGGRVLLGVSPKADGQLPAWQVRILEGIGTWMREGGQILRTINRPGITPVQVEGAKLEDAATNGTAPNSAATSNSATDSAATNGAATNEVARVITAATGGTGGREYAFVFRPEAQPAAGSRTELGNAITGGHFAGSRAEGITLVAPAGKVLRWCAGPGLPGSDFRAGAGIRTQVPPTQSGQPADFAYSAPPTQPAQFLPAGQRVPVHFAAGSVGPVVFEICEA
ncbi:alpha-L-fucosidase [Actinobaculum suis]|uniref:alpha-L-fucosidase n=1 Tax=Actinobaculum suis TaxID=1657 RepID=UPI0018CCC175|nr:alpha-L-fucosidase [Actinobaculum suis]